MFTINRTNAMYIPQSKDYCTHSETTVDFYRHINTTFRQL